MRPKCSLIPSPSSPTTESVISYNTWPQADRPRPKLRAVAATLQQDLSAICTLASSGIDRPAKVMSHWHNTQGRCLALVWPVISSLASPYVCLPPICHPCTRGPLLPQLEGKRYASYAARYEGRIVQVGALLQADSSQAVWVDVSGSALQLDRGATVGARGAKGTTAVQGASPDKVSPTERWLLRPSPTLNRS